MIKYDENLLDELDKLINDYERLKIASPKLDRKGIIMMLCSGILRDELEYNRERECCEYNKLPNELKEMYDYEKSKHPTWIHAQIMAKIAISTSFDTTVTI